MGSDSKTTAHPGRQIHVVLDNLNSHKPKADRWLARHPNMHFYFTPTQASWLNQIEIWFSILADQSLAGASFTSVTQLSDHIDSFIAAYNEHAKPSVGPNQRSVRNGTSRKKPTPASKVRPQWQRQSARTTR